MTDKELYIVIAALGVVTIVLGFQTRRIVAKQRREHRRTAPPSPISDMPPSSWVPPTPTQELDDWTKKLFVVVPAKAEPPQKPVVEPTATKPPLEYFFKNVFNGKPVNPTATGLTEYSRTGTGLPLSVYISVDAYQGDPNLNLYVPGIADHIPGGPGILGIRFPEETTLTTLFKARGKAVEWLDKHPRETWDAHGVIVR